MSNVDNNMLVWTLASITHELATEIDLHYEDGDLATMGEDTALVALRQGTAMLRRCEGPVSEAVAHVEARLERACPSAAPPPEVLESDLPVSFASWSAGRSA